MATAIKKRLTHGLWFSHQAEDAARFYTSLFPNSSIGHITRYGKEGFEFHGQSEGSVMSCALIGFWR